ncbi:MAG: hypothetical protein JNL71_10850, partial [Rhodospirillales bacterium]|nr:hypothetical protein [Rhodospirillales bacterium]
MSSRRWPRNWVRASNAATRPSIRSPAPMPARRMATDGLLKLLAWLSPSFPVGAFAYSHGLEAAIEEGLVRDRAGLQEWIADLVAYGSPRADAVLFCHAYRAVAADDRLTFLDVAELAGAM